MGKPSRYRSIILLPAALVVFLIGWIMTAGGNAPATRSKDRYPLKDRMHPFVCCRCTKIEKARPYPRKVKHVRYLFFLQEGMCEGFLENRDWPGYIFVGCKYWYKHPWKRDLTEYDLRDLCRITSHETIHGVLDSLELFDASKSLDSPLFHTSWYGDSGLPLDKEL